MSLSSIFGPYSTTKPEGSGITCRKPTIEVDNLPDFLRASDNTATAFAIRPGMSLAEV